MVPLVVRDRCNIPGSGSKNETRVIFESQQEFVRIRVATGAQNCLEISLVSLEPKFEIPSCEPRTLGRRLISCGTQVVSVP